MVLIMLTLNDIDTIENGAETEEDYFLSIQSAINGGSWALQGSYGRAMMDAINNGQCLLGRTSFRDYWGNAIPGRDDVKPGTTGSYDFVLKTMGQEWADLMGAN
jgi:hypothetical protein